MPDEEKTYSMDDPETQAPVPVEGQTGGVQYSQDPDEEGYELRYPRLRLLQSSSPLVRQGIEHAGKYVVDNFGAFDEPEVIPLARGLSRELRLSREEDPDRPVICRSNDAKVGVGEPGGNCATCPWANNGCSLIHSFIVYMADLDLPLRWDLQGSGKYTAQDINTLIKMKGFEKFSLKLGKREAGEKDVKYLVPTIRMLPLPQDLTLPQLT